MSESVTEVEVIEAPGWKLVDEKTGKPLFVGQRRFDFRGDVLVVSGGRPPHKPASTGRVYVSDDGTRHAEYYPSVVDACWIKTTGGSP